MTAVDEGLLSPVTAGHDETVTDAAFLDALVTAEVALSRAYRELGLAPDEAVDEIEAEFGWHGALRGCRGHGLDVAALAAASVAGGNPVIPLVAQMRERVAADARSWLHRGATSQDIVDTALMLVARAASERVIAALAHAEVSLRSLARSRRDDVAAARTLTQHAVPTTVGLRAAGWLRAVTRAKHRLDGVRRELPAQLGGAAGTAASFVEHTGSAARARELIAGFAHEVGLDAPPAPWHTSRWPVTELGDALVQAVDAVGKIATDVATLSRTEIGEVSTLRQAQGEGYGASSAMPQKRNPAASVLIRSAALRAPQLAATLHLASALAGDERPDGAWHAEWPTLRELLRLALGATAHTASLVTELHVEPDAVARNLGATRGLLVSERLSIVLTPLIGAEGVRGIVAAAARGDDIATLVRGFAAVREAGVDVDALLDPARYTGLAGEFVDDAVGRDGVHDTLANHGGTDHGGTDQGDTDQGDGPGGEGT
ncbi:lyase family protein [Microbacterium cremeum]|uniref:lyase family protein n=1 Tax=Microbacterium cremeum TaxID=2782169 RepID=UPI001E4891F7|nr:lyase family protein [Microbacterium cremeum]